MLRASQDRYLKKMSDYSQELHKLLQEMAELIDQQADPDPQLYMLFFQQPELSLKLIDIINQLDEEDDETITLYSACVFAMDICVAQLQGAIEAKHKVRARLLSALMNHLAEVINEEAHTLSFWLPVLNSFYESHVELNDALKAAYLNLVSLEEAVMPEESFNSHLDAIRELIQDLSDLSVFDIAENFFAQSYAMPAEFFADLIYDLYSIEEGVDIGLFTLLHPKAEVRAVAVDTLDMLIEQIQFTSNALSRLQSIMYWYPQQYHAMFQRWIKIQRKKGVVFASEPRAVKVEIKATEVDGSGSQGLFLHIRYGRKNRLGGLLLKYDTGTKDAWITPELPVKEVKEYYQQAFSENVTLRTVDMSYFVLFAEHFLAINLEHGEIPNMHFLELQELLGVRLKPNKIDMDDLLTQLSVQITPFTQEMVCDALQRSKSWLTTKPFTESWFTESPLIDKLVNHNSSFVDGVRVCNLENAMDAVFAEDMEEQRPRWQFHFLWMALWMKAKERRNEKVWKDSFIIAHSIHEGKPLKEIPVMQEICRQTVINSVETMHERRTHFSQE